MIFCCLPRVRNAAQHNDQQYRNMVHSIYSLPLLLPCFALPLNCCRTGQRDRKQFTEAKRKRTCTGTS